MSHAPTFPAYYTRAYPGGTACGHQHHRTIRAINCASQRSKRPDVEVVEVLRVRKDGNEKVVATWKKGGEVARG